MEVECELYRSLLRSFKLYRVCQEELPIDIALLRPPFGYGGGGGGCGGGGYYPQYSPAPEYTVPVEELRERERVRRGDRVLITLPDCTIILMVTPRKIAA